MAESPRIIHQYCKGDAPEVRTAYLRGVILQDNEFISSGHCFFIRPDDQVPDDAKQTLAESDIWIDDGEANLVGTHSVIREVE